MPHNLSWQTISRSSRKFSFKTFSSDELFQKKCLKSHFTSRTNLSIDSTSCVVLPIGCAVLWAFSVLIVFKNWEQLGTKRAKFRWASVSNPLFSCWRFRKWKLARFYLFSVLLLNGRCVVKWDRQVYCELEARDFCLSFSLSNVCSQIQNCPEFWPTILFCSDQKSFKQ